MLLLSRFDVSVLNLEFHLDLDFGARTFPELLASSGEKHKINITTVNIHVNDLQSPFYPSFRRSSSHVMTSEPYSVESAMEMYNHLITNLLRRGRFGEAKIRIEEAYRVNHKYVCQLSHEVRAYRAVLLEMYTWPSCARGVIGYTSAAGQSSGYDLAASECGSTRPFARKTY